LEIVNQERYELRIKIVNIEKLFQEECNDSAMNE